MLGARRLAFRNFPAVLKYFPHRRGMLFAGEMAN
jgi:hypothetical protein